MANKSSTVLKFGLVVVIAVIALAALAIALGVFFR